MLTNKELDHIDGGAVRWGIGIAIGSVITLLIGIIDGYLRPLKCNN